MATGSHPFNDVGQRYDEAIDMLYSSNAVKGISSNEFGVYQNIKRGDAAVILARVLELDTVNAPEAGFQDVNSRIRGPVNALVQAGIIKGFSETEFAPDHYLTRGQMASILVNAYVLQEHMKQTPFTDLSKSFKREIEALYGAGITGGVSDLEYGTNLNIKRGDFAALLYKTMKFSGKVTTPSELETKTLVEFYEKNLDDVTKLVIRDGSTGAQKTVTEKGVIEEFLAKIKDIKFIPEKNQETRVGWRYSITLFQDEEETLKFELTKVEGNYYYTEPDIFPIVDDFYKNLNVPVE
jgi:hypothetical protein